MKRAINRVALWILLSGWPVFVKSAELTEEVIQKAVKGNLEAFERIEIPASGEPVSFAFPLGETVAEEGEFLFDGFRFTPPDEWKGDFIWYFNVPDEWGQWYILATEGEPKRAFRNWLDADKLYDPLDQVNEDDRLRILQTLQSDYFEKGKEYVIWFRRVKPDEPEERALRGVLGFFETPEEDRWDHEEIETALNLKPAPAADQVAVLESRGGEILLDERYFKPGYAHGRIDHVFWSIRQTVRMRSGFFITIQTATPPCKTKPLLSEIVEHYGEPDFVRDASELKEKGAEPDDLDIETHYFDYFGFEVRKGNADPGVVRVVSQANDFSRLQVEGDSTFASLELENLTVFHREKKEVGRMYFFQEGGKDVIVVNEPPVGVYENGGTKLEYFGDGKWTGTTRFENDQVARVLRFAGHRLSGKSEGFYQDGKPYYVAEYKDGLIHGELVQYAEDGSVTRTYFVKGERQE